MTGHRDVQGPVEVVNEVWSIAVAVDIPVYLPVGGPEAETELPARVAAVQSYLINDNAVGSIENPKQWFRGTMAMRWGRVSEYASDIAFFCGMAEKKRVALIGSSESLIGAPQSVEANHAPFYYELRAFNDMLEAKGFKAGGRKVVEHNKSNAQKRQASSIEIALRALPPVEREFEFLAFVLRQDSELIVATPLYVAMAT